jgi:hypothetical protein
MTKSPVTLLRKLGDAALEDAVKATEEVVLGQRIFGGRTTIDE